ncbi:MAG: glycosyltransferase family 2 protein [Chthoniobacteraceae bacterium]
MLVSLIIPVLNEQENIAHLWKRLGEVTSGVKDTKFEVVFVDDGSTDETTREIGLLPKAEHLVWKLLELSRNFGHQAAVSAGMEDADGDAFIFLDADLQDPPELIPALLEKYRAGYDVVYGVRQNRKEPLWLRLCFRAFYRLFNAIAERPMPLDAGEFGLVSRRVGRLLAEMPERDRLIRGMRSWVGFRQIGLPYDRPERHAGTTSYSIRRRIEGALDGLFGYSKLPIRLTFFLGILVFLICGTYLGISYIGMMINGTSVVIGWRSVITLAFMLGGANLIAISVVGEYVCRIYFQGKQRPLFIVANTRSSNEPQK